MRSTPTKCTICINGISHLGSRMFRYPKDPKYSKLWKQASGKPENWTPRGRDGICGFHFTHKQFYNSNKNVDTLGWRHMLFPFAIPTVNLKKQEKCFVCFENEISQSSLNDTSTYSSKTLLEILENILQAKVHLQPGICDNCNSMLNVYDMHTRAAQNIREKFIEFFNSKSEEDAESDKPLLQIRKSELIELSSDEDNESDTRETDDEETFGQWFVDSKQDTAVKIKVECDEKPITIEKVIQECPQSPIETEVKMEVEELSVNETTLDPSGSNRCLVIEPNFRICTTFEDCKNTIETGEDRSNHQDVGRKTLSKSQSLFENQVKTDDTIAILRAKSTLTSNKRDTTELIKEAASTSSTNLKKKKKTLDKTDKTDKTSPFHKKREVLCDKCGKYFKTGQTMELHQLSHENDHLRSSQTGKKKKVKKRVNKNGVPYGSRNKEQCQICGKIFNQWDLKNRHMLTHQNIKRFECPMCPLKYTVNNNLKLHFVRCHSENYESPNIYICLECPARFNTIPELKLHFEDLHKEIMNQYNSMELQNSSHEQDNLPPEKPKPYARRMKKNGEPYKVKKIPCPVCEKLFTPYHLNRHLKVHDKEEESESDTTS